MCRIRYVKTLRDKTPRKSYRYWGKTTVGIATTPWTKEGKLLQVLASGNVM